MMQLLLSCCLISLALGATVPDATLNPAFRAWSGRIVGGLTATPGQFRYQASLRSTGNAHFCGGTLVSNRWVISAAHCTIGRTTANTIIVLGTVSRTTGGTTFSITRIVNHPSYSSNTLSNDISMVQTTANVANTATIGPAALGSAFVATGTAIASGWGQTSNPGSVAANLQWVSLNIITNADCRSRHRAANAARVLDNTICSFTRAGQGTCMGDSGGPLAQGNTVIGAVSWGIACAQGFPDVYARISSHRAWITSVSGL